MTRLRCFLLLPALVACGPAPISPTAAADPPQEVVLREADAGGRAVVARGGILVIDLPEVPGTGFGWALAEHDASHLEPVGDDLVPGAALPGAEERHVFRLRARTPGSSAILLNYRRPFEKDEPPARTYRVTIDVR